MLEMSVAFDTFDRTILSKDLSTNIDNGELHLIKTMLSTELIIQYGFLRHIYENISRKKSLALWLTNNL